MNDLDNILAETQTDAMPLSKEEFAEKKQAERQAVYDLADQTAFDVAEDSGRFKQYLDVQSQFDRYSETNALLVLAQKPEATRLGDFEHWKAQGGFVRKGETGISIIEPSGEYERDDGKTGISYNIKKVFDISQIDVRKMEQAPPKPQVMERQLLKSLIAHAPVKVDLVDELSGNMGAMYDAQTDRLLVCRGKEFSESFKSIAQATAYYFLTTGPDTQSDPHFSSMCAAYMLCKKHGVDAQDFKFDHAPAKLAGLDALDIKGELSQIRDVSADISMHMAKTLEPPSRGARVQDAATR